MTDKPETPTRFVWTFEVEVLSCKEVTEEYNHRKIDPNRKPAENNSTHDVRSKGWSVRISDGSAIGFFPADPGYKKGDVLSLSVTKKR